MPILPVVASSIHLWRLTIYDRRISNDVMKQYVSDAATPLPTKPLLRKLRARPLEGDTGRFGCSLDEAPVKHLVALGGQPLEQGYCAQRDRRLMKRYFCV